jgi:hypothetical protein
MGDEILSYSAQDYANLRRTLEMPDWPASGREKTVPESH